MNIPLFYAAISERTHKNVQTHTGNHSLGKMFTHNVSEKGKSVPFSFLKLFIAILSVFVTRDYITLTSIHILFVLV